MNLLKNFIINLKLFIIKKLELNQMEGLEAGFDWGNFGGNMAFAGVCGYVGFVASFGTTPIGGAVVGVACSAVFAALAANK